LIDYSISSLCSLRFRGETGISICHDLNRDLANLFLSDYRRALDHFERHPVMTPLSERESGSFKHS